MVSGLPLCLALAFLPVWLMLPLSVSGRCESTSIEECNSPWKSRVGSSLVINTFNYTTNHSNHLQYQNTYSGAN